MSVVDEKLHCIKCGENMNDCDCKLKYEIVTAKGEKHYRSKIECDA